MLPMALTVCSDAYAGIQRITKALLAEDLEDELQIDTSAPDAIRGQTLAPTPSALSTFNR